MGGVGMTEIEEAMSQVDRIVQVSRMSMCLLE